MDNTGTRFRKAAVAVLAVAAWAAGGCGEAPVPRFETIRIAVLPGEDPVDLRQQFSPLIAYLEGHTDISCELVLHDSYESFEHAFAQGDIDLAWFGGYTFVNAQRRHGAVPIVCRDRDLRFTSDFLVRRDSDLQRLEDCRGKRLAFGSRLSTSGHLMPRYFLSRWGMTPEEYFGDVRFTGSHDTTALAVQRGEVDVGVVNSVTVERMLESGELDEQQVRILKETPPFVDYVWASQASMPRATRTLLCDAFLRLATDDPVQAAMLDRLGASYYLPVSPAAFAKLTSIIDSLPPEAGP